MDNEKDIVIWSVNSIEAKPYDTTTWYRCVGVQDFVEKVQKDNNIVAVVFSGNNLGFILDKK